MKLWLIGNCEHILKLPYFYFFSSCLGEMIVNLALWGPILDSSQTHMVKYQSSLSGTNLEKFSEHQLKLFGPIEKWYYIAE